MLIGVLGPLEVNGSRSGLGRRDRVVLEALAMRVREVRSPDDLADALWPVQRPDTWAKVVQGAIVRLRRALGRGAVELVAGGYRLVVDDGDVDVVEFERLVERGRSLLAVNEPARALAAYDDALRLWRGTPMDDLLDWPPGRDEALRLADVHGAAQEERLEAALACGRANEAVSAARRLVGEAPLRERRWHVLAAALYGAGRQVEALSALREATRVLREESGLDPSPMLGALEQAILRQDAALPQARRVRRSSGVCPYPGLSSYQASDSEHYVGRETDVAACLRRLAEDALLVVVGPSGCGKSSLVRAGVVPALQQRGQFMAVITPMPDPLDALARARADAPRGAGLVVDQLEELSASEQDPGLIRAFLDEAAAWTRRGPVVLAVRADHLTDLAISPDLAALTDGAIRLLTPMSTTELRRVIEEPARKTGVVLEPGLVDLLLRDVAGEPGALPLLSHALRETWERREGDVLTVEAYLRTGGISGAVAQTADQVYDTLSDDQRVVLRGLMLRLVTSTADGAPVSTRLATAMVHAKGEAEPVLRRLVASRLITADDTTVAIAHESLATVWPRLRAWLDEDIEGRRILGHLQVAADGWASAGCPASELYRGARLQAALEWRARAHPMLTAAEDRFLASSIGETEDESERERLALAAQRRQNRRLRRSLAVATLLFAVAVAAGAVALGSERHARASARDAAAARLGDAALVDPRADTSVLLARQAVALANTPQTAADLLAALDARRGLQLVTNLDVSGFIGAQVQVAPDLHRMLALQLDGIHLINVSTGQRLPNGKPVVAGDTAAALYPAGFLDDGRVAAVSEAYGTAAAQGRQCRLRYFAASSGLAVRSPEPLPRSRCGDFVTMDRPRVSADGRRLVSMSGTDVRIWDRHGTHWAGPRVVAVPNIPEGERIPRSITLSSDGRRAAILLELGAAAPWYRFLEIVAVVDLDAGQLLSPPMIDPTTSTAAALAPNGSRIAIGRVDGTLDVVTVGGNTAAPTEPPLHLLGQSEVSTVAWSDNGAHVLIGREDGQVQVVDARTASLASSWTNHGRRVVLVAGAGNESRLLSMDDSGVALLWDTRAAGPLGPSRVISRPHAVAVGPEGTPIAVGHDNGRVQLYDPGRLTPLRTMFSLGPYPSPDSTAAPAIHRRVSALAITPDGRHLVAGDRVGHLRIWTLSDHRLVWSRDDVPVAFLAVSPDGRYLATAEFTQAPDDPAPDSAPVESKVRLWNLTNGRMLATWQTGDKKPRAVAFTTDSRRLLVGFFSEPADILAVPTGAPIAHLHQSVSSVAFSPDGSTMVAVDFQGTVSLVNTNHWTIRQRVPTAADYSHVAFSADGRFLFLSNEATTAIWHAHQYRLLVPSFSLPGDDTNDAIFLAVPKDRNELILASQTMLTRLDLRQQLWEQAACHLAGRQLTKDEWQRFLPGRPYAPACSK